MAHITPCVKDGILHVFEGGWQRGIRVESNTTLYTFGQRYYDTDLGRWTQMDPVGGTVGNPNSGNPYVYANDLPNMLTDPTGRATPGCIFGLIASGAAFGAAVIEGGPFVVALIQALLASTPLTGVIGPGLAGALAIIAGAAWLTQAILYCNGIL